MLNQEDIKYIHYFKDLKSIEEIKKGYNGRKKYKIITKNQDYFIKIHHYKLTEKEIMKEKILYEIYRSLEIPVVPLLDVIEYKNKTMFIYPFFKGTNLRDVNVTLDEYYQYGKKVGKEILKLQDVSINSKFFAKVNLDEYFNHQQKQIKKLWENVVYQQKILQLFSKEELRSLEMLYETLLNFVKKQKFSFNHNDIKIANIMLDEKMNYYLIDIDPIDLTPAGFNICYSIYSFLLLNFQETEKSFLKGFIQTIDPNREIIKQLQYFLMIDMINESEKLLNNYFNELDENKEYMKKMLFNKNNFLEEIIYNEI